ncbi:MAG: MoaD/ThiS family protein [Gemmatimonadota bacterium]
MSIPIHLPSVLAGQAGGVRRVDVNAPTVGAALDALVASHPAIAPRLRDESGNVYPFVTIYLNDEDIRLVGGFDATLADGDEISVVPAVAGG